MSLNESWRLLILGAMEPHDGLSVTEVLLTAFKRNLIPNTLFLWVSTRPYVYVGEKTGVERVRVDREYCRIEGIPLIREVRGSGAAIDDSNTVAYRLVSSGKLLNHTLAMTCIAKGLQFMGVQATYQRPKSNNILVNEKKVVSGASSRGNGFFTFGGSVVMDFDYEFCENALLVPPEKWVNKAAKSHREWVTSIKAQLGREVSFDETVSAVRRGFEDVLHIEFDVAHSFTEAEKRIFEGLKEKYRSEEWNLYGRWSPVKEYRRPNL